MTDMMEQAVASAMTTLMARATEFGFERVRDAITVWDDNQDGSAPKWAGRFASAVSDAFRDVQDSTENMVSISISYPNGDQIIWSWLNAEGHPGSDYHKAVVDSVQRALLNNPKTKGPTNEK